MTPFKATLVNRRETSSNECVGTVLKNYILACNRGLERWPANDNVISKSILSCTVKAKPKAAACAGHWWILMGFRLSRWRSWMLSEIEISLDRFFDLRMFVFPTNGSKAFSLSLSLMLKINRAIIIYKLMFYCRRLTRELKELLKLPVSCLPLFHSDLKSLSRATLIVATLTNFFSRVCLTDMNAFETIQL